MSAAGPSAVRPRAGRPERAVHGVHVAAGLGLGLAAAIGIFLADPALPVGLVPA